ncbi:hypothetical protein D9M71_718670 [compost metagenome]
MPGHARAVVLKGGLSEVAPQTMGQVLCVPMIPVSIEPESYRMNRVFEDLMFQMLIDQALKQIYHQIQWFNTMPWQVWFA